MADSSSVLIVGAGPAGASLAYLLARCGVEVTLLERQRDFAREFRGEVLMTSGVAALEAMGLGAALAELPAFAPPRVELYLRRECVLDLELRPEWFGGRTPVALSQPALLERLVAEGAAFPSHRFVRGAGARELLREGGRVVGVRAQTAEGSRELRADLVVGCDGRASLVRRRLPLAARARDLPMDIVWCKLPCPEFVAGARAYVGGGHLLLCYRTWDGQLQVAWVILKGTYGELKRHGVEHWVAQMARHVSPDLGEHLAGHLDAVRRPFLLDCQADRAVSWSAPGALVLGDAAHVMSPVGAQGLNIALRDALVAANHLVPAVRSGGGRAALDAAARRIEAERLPEVAPIQRLQALPPRLLLSRAWWSGPLRRLAGALLATGFGRRRAVPGARPFVFGLTDVRLRV